MQYIREVSLIPIRSPRLDLANLSRHSNHFGQARYILYCFSSVQAGSRFIGCVYGSRLDINRLVKSLPRSKCKTIMSYSVCQMCFIRSTPYGVRDSHWSATEPSRPIGWAHHPRDRSHGIRLGSTDLKARIGKSEFTFNKSSNLRQQSTTGQRIKARRPRTFLQQY